MHTDTDKLTHARLHTVTVHSTSKYNLSIVTIVKKIAATLNSEAGCEGRLGQRIHGRENEHRDLGTASGASSGGTARPPAQTFAR